nr:RDD family protein [Rhodovulum bhavnagarense]
MKDMSWGLPDPVLHREFYDDVPLKRLGAWLVDSVVILLLSLLALPFTAFAAILIYPAFLVAISLAYRTVTLSRGSATWGMRLMAIEIRNGRGERLDRRTALLHTLMYTASFLLVLPQIGSILLMLTAPRAQGLGDVLLGTAAINRPAQG